MDLVGEHKWWEHNNTAINTSVIDDNVSKEEVPIRNLSKDVDELTKHLLDKFSPEEQDRLLREIRKNLINHYEALLSDINRRADSLKDSINSLTK